MQLTFPENGDLPKPKPKRRKPRTSLPYSDIDLSIWKEYGDVWTDSLWLMDSRGRGKGHALDYHGNFVPQIATQIFARYSKSGDIALDMFLGSGTSAIEAFNMGRRLIGIEINERQAEIVRQKLGAEGIQRGIHIITGDSSSRRVLKPIRKILAEYQREFAQLLILHPPYHNIIKFSEDERDLSNAAATEDYLRAFKRTAKTGYDLLEPGRFAVLVIGDKYENGELIPLGFLCMQQMLKSGFKIKSIVVKNIVGNERGKGKSTNLWRYRALAGGFYLFKHEYVIIFQKAA